MNLQTARRYNKRLSLTEGIIKNNVVFTMGLGLPLVIAASTELKKGVVISLLMLLSNLSGGLLHLVLGKRVPKPIRIPLIALASMAVVSAVVPKLTYFSTQISELGVYVPLVAINSILFDAILSHKESGVMATAVRSVSYSAGFILVMCSMSFVREILVELTVWDQPLPVEVFSEVSVSSAQTVFFGFIAVGMLWACFRMVDRMLKYLMILRPKYSTRVSNKPKVRGISK